LKSTQAIIGTAMIFNIDRLANQAEIGYVIHKDHWNEGYGSEAVALVSDFSFTALKLHKIHASVVDVNICSARILEKNGYQMEGRLRDNYYIENSYYDALLYGKINPRD
jgi:ribosomal-protein-alanine N-acetyltransferase